MKTLLRLIIVFTIIIPTMALSQEADQHYKIGPNDLLTVFVWNEPDLTQDVTVMFDGRLTFPLIGEVMAKGETVTGLADILKTKLEDYVSAPEVTVMVKEIRSRKIYVIGQINQPGPYPLDPDMTVLQALATAGGFTEWANKKSVLVVRRQDGKENMYRFNYQDFIEGKNLSQNIPLEPNDTIVVP